MGLSLCGERGHLGVPSWGACGIPPAYAGRGQNAQMCCMYNMHDSREHIVRNEQAIVDNLTEDNATRVLASRRTAEGEQLYLVYDQGSAGTSPPNKLLVKKFHNANPALQVDGNVMYRCNSEMFLLANISHKNIIKVVDHIQREDAIMLIYEYPVHGSLRSWLHQPMDAGRHLSWPDRRGIAIGVARGLRQLHHRCNKLFVHHNINSENILLDQNFKAVIASFGAAQVNMAGLGQPLPITDLRPGNFGYAAPEYGLGKNQLTEKVDIYSFGVLMLELVTGNLTSDASGWLIVGGAMRTSSDSGSESEHGLEGIRDESRLDHLQPGALKLPQISDGWSGHGLVTKNAIHTDALNRPEMSRLTVTHIQAEYETYMERSGVSATSDPLRLRACSVAVPSLCAASTGTTVPSPVHAVGDVLAGPDATAKPLFLRIMEGVEAHEDYFKLKRYCCSQHSFSAKVKCMTALRMLALGTAAEAVGEMVRMGESTCLKTTVKFSHAVVQFFGAEYLREQNAEDADKLLAIGDAKGF
ncbi:probable leucine-rich repeat receptor-like protein kinase At5g49770 [Triticum aestivum]|uniref:probable leucine-rich repeat receptor-like protein kinase At5g49770 n=1 Tax=Triticum aestivum TaxID=4565 RepID=UPI001D00530C|nr:probable leucine-rich repeat receptor-like protein kinase At5g49770 [Triticum aestivum]